MFDDPRWGSDPRERDDDARDRDPVDPRDAFVDKLDLPRGLERELVRDRDREYTLRGSESRTLSVIGSFRVISSRDLSDHDGRPLDPRRGDLRHLREQGLVRTIPIDGGRDVAVVLTGRGRDLLESHRRDGDGRSPGRGAGLGDSRQQFYAELKKPREIEHDVQIYRAYEREAARLHERGARIERVVLDYEQKREYQQFLRMLAVATDFPRLWHDPHTPDRERKRMVRLLMEDVTLIKTPDGLTVHLRFRGGAATTLTLARALNAWQLRETSAEIVALIDQLLDSHADGDIAMILNARGYVSGTGQPFQRRIVKHIRHSHRLCSRYVRLRARGMLTRDEIAHRLHVSADTVKIWGRHGLLRRHQCNDKHECLYEPPGPNAPVKVQGRPLSDRRRRDLLTDQTNGVQYEA